MTHAEKALVALALCDLLQKAPPPTCTPTTERTLAHAVKTIGVLGKTITLGGVELTDAIASALREVLADLGYREDDVVEED